MVNEAQLTKSLTGYTGFKLLFDAVIGQLYRARQGPVASATKRAVVCWLASHAPQLLQICLLSAWCSPSKC